MFRIVRIRVECVPPPKLKVSRVSTARMHDTSPNALAPTEPGRHRFQGSEKAGEEGGELTSSLAVGRAGWPAGTTGH